MLSISQSLSISQLPSPLEESELILFTVGIADRQSFQLLLQQLDQHRVQRALLWLHAEQQSSLCLNINH